MKNSAASKCIATVLTVCFLGTSGCYQQYAIQPSELRNLDGYRAVPITAGPAISTKPAAYPAQTAPAVEIRPPSTRKLKTVGGSYVLFDSGWSLSLRPLRGELPEWFRPASVDIHGMHLAVTLPRTPADRQPIEVPLELVQKASVRKQTAIPFIFGVAVVGVLLFGIRSSLEGLDKVGMTGSFL